MNPMTRAIPDPPVCRLCGNDIDHWTHDTDPERHWCAECIEEQRADALAQLDQTIASIRIAAIVAQEKLL